MEINLLSTLDFKFCRCANGNSNYQQCCIRVINQLYWYFTKGIIFKSRGL